MKKAAVFMLLLVLCLGLCSACTPQEEPSTDPQGTVLDEGVLYQSETVKVRLQKEGEIPPRNREMDYMPLTEEMAYENSPIIFSGQVEKVIPLVIEAPKVLSEEDYFRCIVEMKPVSVLQDRDGFFQTHSGTVTVLLPYNMLHYDDDYPALREGMTLLMKCSLSPEDKLETAQWADLVPTHSHIFVMEKVGDYYIAGSFFKDYIPGQKSIYDVMGLTQETYDSITGSDTVEFYPIDSNTWQWILQNCENKQEMYDIISALKKRGQFMGLFLEHTYAIPCDQLETAIQERASKYK